MPVLSSCQQAMTQYTDLAPKSPLRLDNVMQLRIYTALSFTKAQLQPVVSQEKFMQRLMAGDK
jgi:hypothetical protein